MSSKKIFVVSVFIVLILIATYFVLYSNQKLHTQQTPAFDTSNRIEEQKTNPESNRTQNFITFINTKYNYTFSYPQDKYLSIGSNEYATDPENSFNVFLSSSQFGEFNVVAKDPEQFKNPVVVKTLELPLKEFVEEIWQLNKNNAGEIFQTTINDRPAFYFTLEDSYTDIMGGYLLDKEYIYFFVENKGLNFEISFPTNDPVSKDIFDSFKFVN